MLVIADASPLIFLDRLGHLSLLPALYRQVVVPRAVLDEVSEGADPDSELAKLDSVSWIEVAPREEGSALLAALLGELGEGEASAISLARSSGAELVLIDERQGRRIARRLGLVVKGTLGVLVEARREGLISELRPLLEQLAEAGAWLSEAIVREALASVGEEE